MPSARWPLMAANAPRSRKACALRGREAAPRGPGPRPPPVATRRGGLAGFWRTATRETLGATALSISNCFPTSCGPIVASPVMLPPGRARLATKPSATGSPETVKTIGIVLVACLAALVAAGDAGDDDIHLQANEIGGERRQPLILPLGRPILDHDVLTFDVAQLAQPLPECFVEERGDVAQEPDLGGLPPRLLRLGGERRGEETASDDRHESASRHLGQTDGVHVVSLHGSGRESTSGDGRGGGGTCASEGGVVGGIRGEPQGASLSACRGWTPVARRRALPLAGQRMVGYVTPGRAKL